jgi:hypothetical protein
LNWIQLGLGLVDPLFGRIQRRRVVVSLAWPHYLAGAILRVESAMMKKHLGQTNPRHHEGLTGRGSWLLSEQDETEDFLEEERITRNNINKKQEVRNKTKR